MALFLQIVGGVVVALVLIVILIYAWSKIRFGRHLSLADGDNEPLQLHLNEQYAPEWREKGEAGELLAELQNCGFELGKAYSVLELEGVNVQSLFNPPFIATLYEHPQVRSWVDLSFTAEDEDLEIDVCNAELGETIKVRPETRKIYLKQARVLEMLTRLKQEAGDHKGAFINDSNYREHFEESYRRDMIWRCSQGGMTYEEFVATAESGNTKYKKKQMKEAFIDTKVQELHRWHDAAMQRMLELDPKFVEAVYEKGKDIFTLPEQGNVEAFIRYLGDSSVIDDDQAEAMINAFSGQSDLQMVARRIFEGISTDFRPRKLRDIDFPVSGEIYEYS